MKLTETLIGLLFGQGARMPRGNFARALKSLEDSALIGSRDADLVKPSFWQLVFLQSKVNGATYQGETLPGRHWDWPKDTYLQRRMQQSKWCQNTESAKMN